MTEKTAIIDFIENHINNDASYPVLNPHALEVQNEITRNDPDFRTVSKLIQKDPTLTSEILKTANSPLYRGLHTVETIKDAMLRLGQTEMVNIVMLVIHKNQFSFVDPMIKPYQKKLWNHLVACATGAAWTARHLSMEELIPKAFIGGLLHDMGKLFILSAIDNIKKTQSTAMQFQPELIEVILDRFHARHGYALLTKWNLPKPYCIVARDHHLESYDSSDLLLNIVRIVNMTCQKIETNDPKQDLSGIISSLEADSLGLSDTDIALLEIFLEDTYKRFS